MAKLKHLLITLPILVAAIFASGLRPAGAGVATPMRVVEIVSKAESLDGKCRMLGSREYADLGRYLAKGRAEAACRDARNN